MKKEQRRNLGEKIAQGILLIVLITLTIFMMSDVKKIQGNARVINYAGIIRGATQREIKLEISGNENDVLIKYLDDIFKMSEEYFYLADETVTAAEDYSQKCATRLDQIEKALIFVIALVILMMIKESVSAVVLMKKNRELNKKAYIDLHTGLPNRSRVEELIAHYDHFDEPTAIIVFDLNDLKVVNDSLGHLAGDTLIMNFAHIIRTSIPEKYFVGRYGGDEFIALLNDVTQQDVEDIILQVQNEARCYNEFSKQIFIDFAFGYALSTHSRETNLKLLLNQADKNMYECKARMKAKKKI